MTSQASAATPIRIPNRNVRSDILDSSPVKATFISDLRKPSQATQMVVDKAACAEAYEQIDACQHKDDQVKRPACYRERGEEEQHTGSQQKRRADPLREAMRSGI